MSEIKPGLTPTPPLNILEKPLEIDYKELFKAVLNGIGHVAFKKLDDLPGDTADLLAAIGFSATPGELAYLLIKRAIVKAICTIVVESYGLLQFDDNEENQSIAIFKKLDQSIGHKSFSLDSQFWEHPGDLPVLKHWQAILQLWLEGHHLLPNSASAVVNRLPSYFIYALNEEWRRNAKSYMPLMDALNTPFTQASEREWAWTTYAALLQREVQKSVFDEPFSLNQIYVPLNGYYFEDKIPDEALHHSKDKGERIVIRLQDELESWLAKPDKDDAVRVISGGPGSGKSSFARVFAAHLSQPKYKLKVLFIPLHLIDPEQELVSEVGRFVRDEGILRHNPLDPDADEANLLLIFDGLDELSSQGGVATQVARNFINEVQRTVDRRNMRKVKLRVLFSGRELIVQENQSEFRKHRQVLNLLPYFLTEDEQNAYKDPHGQLKEDLRQHWWKTYGALTGMNYKGLPEELNREDLNEVTAQPLLNYLVGLSLIRSQTKQNGVDFSQNISLNTIYADLVAAVYERAYEKRRHISIRRMERKDFERVLEEIGLAAWHGDGRSTTVGEIEAHCIDSGLEKQLDPFKEGAEKGVTRLLAAFFFRQYGQRQNGDPTFVFTHKSFGEYLAAQRIVRGMEAIALQRERRDDSPDDGWNEQTALLYWAKLCGPNPISPYIHSFLREAIALRPLEQAERLQKHFTQLFSVMLKHTLPMEKAELKTFREMLAQSRNAEEALMVALNSCALKTAQVSRIEHPTRTAFGIWFKHIQGQRTGPQSSLVAECFSLLDLNGLSADIGDFYNANLERADLHSASFILANLMATNLKKANLSYARLGRANLEGARLEGARLEGADLDNANLERANLVGANLEGAHLEGAHLEGANLKAANIEGANLKRANLEGANLEGANLEGANLEGANLKAANLKGAHLEGVNMTGASYHPKQLQNTTGKMQK